jgi:hypothetical protein
MAVDDPGYMVKMESAEPGVASFTKAIPDRPAGTSARKTIFAIASATVICEDRFSKKTFYAKPKKARIV